MNDEMVTLDVRPDVQNGRKPCDRLMAAVESLRPKQKLLLIAPFEPKPLFAVMAQRGYAHQATPIGAGDWEVLFEPVPEGMPWPVVPEEDCGGHSCLSTQ